MAQRGAFGADQLQLFLSTTPTLDNLTQLRAEETINVHAGTVTRKCHFVAPMSGTFYLGFKLTSTAGNGLISIKAVKVTLTNKQCPQIASAFTASHNGATGKVKLKWIAPNRDTEGALLQGKLTANVYQDEQQLTTIEDITPGVEASYEITPAAASGQRQGHSQSKDHGKVLFHFFFSPFRLISGCRGTLLFLAGMKTITATR